MVRQDVSRSISMHLNRLFETDRDLTLDYISASTGVPVTTVHRVRQGQSGIQMRNATRLASFIENKTGGNVRADRLMGLSRRYNYVDADMQGANFVGADLRDCDFRGADLRGANLSGADIDGAKFDMALLRGANLANVKGTASFKCAILDEANIENVVIDWDMTSVQARNTTLKNVVFEECVRMNGADFSGDAANWKNVVWRCMGSRTLGTRLPEFDPREVREAFCDHLVLSRGFQVGFGFDLKRDEGDLEMMHLTEFILTRESSLLRCYDGVAKRLLKRHEKRLDEVKNVLNQFDWYAFERLEIALYVRQNCRTLDDYERLVETPFYSESWIPAPKNQETRGSKAIIQKYIHRARRGQMMHAI